MSALRIFVIKTSVSVVLLPRISDSDRPARWEDSYLVKIFENFNAARRKHQPNTGSWFLDSKQFDEWKKSTEVILCLYGICG